MGEQQWSWNDVCGQPVRLTLLDSTSGERQIRLVGLLTSADEEVLCVNCLHPLPFLAPASPVALELLAQGNLYWCHTVVHQVIGSGLEQLELRVPTVVDDRQRRRYPRIDLGLPLHLVVQRTKASMTAVLRDLSAGGASLQARESIAVGERVTMAFALGSGLYLQDLSAEVIRSTKTAGGVYIVAMRFYFENEQVQLLAKWVERQLARGT